MSEPKKPEAQAVVARRDSFPTFRRLLGRFRFLPLGQLRRLPRRVANWFWRNKRRFAMAALTSVALWVATNIYAGVLLNRELEAIKQRGEPLTMVEMVPPIPDAKNAAILYQRADLLLKKLGLDKKEESRIEEWDAEDGKTAASPEVVLMRCQLLQKYRPALEIIRQASRLPLCRFPNRWENLMQVRFTALPILRQYSRLMRASAIQEAHDGHTEQAIEDLGVIYRMSNHAADDPLLVASLTKIHCEGIGHNTLAAILRDSRLTSTQKNRIEAVLPRSSLKQNFARAYLGERTTMTRLTDYLYFSADNSRPSWIRMLADSPILRVLLQPRIKMDKVWFLRTHPANPHPLPSSDVPDYAYATRVNLPGYDFRLRYLTDSNANRGLARVALALDFYQSQNKAYPMTLAQLETQSKTKLPLDSYSGKPFIYRRTKDGYTLYSVGYNNTDDGGRALWEDDLLWAPRID